MYACDLTGADLSCPIVGAGTLLGIHGPSHSLEDITRPASTSPEYYTTISCFTISAYVEHRILATAQHIETCNTPRYCCCNPQQISPGANIPAMLRCPSLNTVYVFADRRPLHRNLTPQYHVQSPKKQQDLQNGEPFLSCSCFQPRGWPALLLK